MVSIRLNSMIINLINFLIFLNQFNLINSASKNNKPNLICNSTWGTLSGQSDCVQIGIKDFFLCQTKFCKGQWGTAICNDNKQKPNEKVICNGGHQYINHKLACSIARPDGYILNQRMCDRIIEGTAPSCPRDKCQGWY
ncbi:hypothetical protein DFH28DRAFT_11938 [Melampsora americana]|nr:hypothetical protein DFH28DRAFT_11938 [Melampsora americana]